MEGIRESMKEQDESLRERYLAQVKQSLILAFDVKRNHFIKILEDFDKRYLRLKIVQHSKKNMPQAFGGDNQGLGFDADQMSMSGQSDMSSSQQSASGLSSSSSFS